MDGSFYVPPVGPEVQVSTSQPTTWLGRMRLKATEMVNGLAAWWRGSEWRPSTEYRWRFPKHTRVDPIAFARRMKAEEGGMRDGSVGLPPSHAREYPTAVQEMIINGRELLDKAIGIQKGVLVEVQRLMQHLVVPDPREPMDYLRQRTTQEMAKHLKEVQAELLDRSVRMVGADRLYQRFKTENRLLRDAEEPPHWLWYGVIALILISVETVMNYKLFEDSTNYGANGAMAIAAAIATFNITVSTLAGYVFGRQCLRVQWLPRLFGWVTSAMFFGAMAVVHSLFATLRYLTSQGTDMDVALRSVWQWQNMQGSAQDGLSLLLVTVGLIISAFGFWKGMTILSDRYPGFLHVFRNRQKARHEYEDMVAVVMDDQAAVATGADEELRRLVQRAETIHGEFTRRAVEVQALNDQHEVVVDDVSAAVQHALNVYVASNVAHRGPSPIPAILRVPVRLRSPLRRLDIDVSAMQAANDRALAATHEKAVEVNRLLAEDHAARIDELNRQLQDIHGRAEEMVTRSFREISGARVEDVRFGPSTDEEAGPAQA